MLLSDHINETSKENPENNKRDQLKDKHYLKKHVQFKIFSLYSSF